MANILLFAFMTFWIWGWIMFWPTSKIKNNYLKGWLTTIGATLFLASMMFNLEMFLKRGGLDAIWVEVGVFFSLGSLTVWIPIVLGLVASYFFREGNDSKNNSWSGRFMSSFVITLLASLIFYILGWFCCCFGVIIDWLATNYFGPLISTLF
jgi:hypothetical protein